MTARREVLVHPICVGAKSARNNSGIKECFVAREMIYGMSDGASMKIGFLSLPLTGHLNPMTALARKLQSRGHEVVFIGVPDIEPVVRAADLDFVPFCENEYPPGSVAGCADGGDPGRI
jgi:hypothetical protein